MNLPRIHILDVPAHVVDFNTAVQTLLDLVRADYGKHYTVALNAEKIMMARHDRLMRAIISHASMIFPDGVGVSLGSRILYRKAVPRVPGYDLFIHLLQHIAGRKLRTFLLGSKPEVIKYVYDKLSGEYGSDVIVGCHHGYFNDDREVINHINSQPLDILFVGLGSPKQEKWIYRNISQLRVKLCMGVGGSFDVLAGRVKLAPARIRKLGFEFVYRLLKEPQRLRRQLVFPKFLGLLLATRTKLIR